MNSLGPPYKIYVSEETEAAAVVTEFKTGVTLALCCTEELLSSGTLDEHPTSPVRPGSSGKPIRNVGDFVRSIHRRLKNP